MRRVLCLGFAACAAPLPVEEAPACDPRVLEPGEVRARAIPCSAELIEGGEGRVGDWLIENASARFVVRGVYAALTELDEGGGTVIDAAAPGGADLLLELRPDGDRTAITAVNGESAALVLPGFAYRLDPDGDALIIEGASTGRLIGRAGVERTGSTLRDDDAFVGVDGVSQDLGGAAVVSEMSRIALSTAGLWPGGTARAGEADADAVRVDLEGAPLVRLSVRDGTYDAIVPVDGVLTGERAGCVYDGLVVRACGSLALRVRDDAGDDLDAILTDGAERWRVPRGGGSIPLGPEPRDLRLWAGPGYTAPELHYPGDGASAQVTMIREIDASRAVLAALGEAGAPDAGTSASPAEVLHALSGEGVGYAVVLADDEVPVVTVDEHDAILAVAGSRAGGWLWSWPWSANSKRAAHGAIPWPGFGALDQLALSEGGAGVGRRMVVTREWVEAALQEAAPALWEPRPDAIWLASLDDAPTYAALLEAWVDVTPLAERTWVGVGVDRNMPAFEAGIVGGATTAGTGPLIEIAAGDLSVSVRLDAARWMRVRTLSLWTAAGIERRAVEGDAEEVFAVPAGTTWAFATAEGDHARPWGADPAWAVSGPVWLGGP